MSNAHVLPADKHNSSSTAAAPSSSSSVFSPFSSSSSTTSSIPSAAAHTATAPVSDLASASTQQSAPTLKRQAFLGDALLTLLIRKRLCTDDSTASTGKLTERAKFYVSNASLKSFMCSIDGERFMNMKEHDAGTIFEAWLWRQYEETKAVQPNEAESTVEKLMKFIETSAPNTMTRNYEHVGERFDAFIALLRVLSLLSLFFFPSRFHFLVLRALFVDCASAVLSPHPCRHLFIPPVLPLHYRKLLSRSRIKYASLSFSLPASCLVDQMMFSFSVLYACVWPCILG